MNNPESQPVTWGQLYALVIWVLVAVGCVVSAGLWWWPRNVH